MYYSKKYLVDYLYIIIGSFILAFALNVFLVPSKITTGGVSGLGTILLYVFDIPLSVSNFVVNACLFIFGYKLLNKDSLIKTVIGIVTLSLFLEVTKLFGSYNDDIIISALFGGAFIGLGIGFVVSREASTGGSDFAAMMIHKKLSHISLIKIIFTIDFSVILLSGIVFENYTILFYSIISLYVSAKVADYILIRGDYAKSIYIISEKSEKIAKSIIDEMNRGVTGIYAKGFYKNNDTTMLMCIVRAKEIPHLFNVVKSIDSASFITVSEVREVMGEGFKRV